MKLDTDMFSAPSIDLAAVLAKWCDDEPITVDTMTASDLSVLQMYHLKATGAITKLSPGIYVKSKPKPTLKEPQMAEQVDIDLALEKLHELSKGDGDLGAIYWNSIIKLLRNAQPNIDRIHELNEHIRQLEAQLGVPQDD